jgi:hypothetical protein
LSNWSSWEYAVLGLLGVQPLSGFSQNSRGSNQHANEYTNSNRMVTQFKKNITSAPLISSQIEHWDYVNWRILFLDILLVQITNRNKDFQLLPIIIIFSLPFLCSSCLTRWLLCWHCIYCIFIQLWTDLYTKIPSRFVL